MCHTYSHKIFFNTIHVTIHITIHVTIHITIHTNPGLFLTVPKTEQWAAHSPNVGSSWWNRIPYPFSVSYSPKHNLLSRTAQMGSKNFHTSVPRFGTDQTATHGLKPTQAFTRGKTSRIKPLPHGVCRNSNFLVSTRRSRCVHQL